MTKPTRMIFENMSFPFGTAFVNFVAMLTEVISCRAKDGQLQFWNGSSTYLRMTTC